MLYMLHHCEFYLIWLQSKLYMGSVCSVAMGIARWSFRLIKDIHFRGLHNDNSSCCLIPSSHITMQICDETNQSKGFAMIATMGGIGRIFVCKMNMLPYILTTLFSTTQGSLTGGFLARPASKYPLLNIPFFCNFPYVLPCLVGVSANIFGLISK